MLRAQILVVDDHAPSCELISEILRSAGFEADSLTSSAEAAERQDVKIQRYILPCFLSELSNVTHPARRAAGIESHSGGTFADKPPSIAVRGEGMAASDCAHCHKKLHTTAFADTVGIPSKTKILCNVCNFCL